MASVLTANRLRSGEVVYLGAGDVWVRDLGDARVAQSDEDVSKLEALGQHFEDVREVISAYVMDVDVVDGRAVATSVREIIRAAHGPSI